MDFGMPTLIENKTLNENLDLSRELGLDFIELNMNVPDYQLEALRHIKREDDIYYTIHLDENLNFADFNREVTKAYIETARETIHIAERIGAPVLNMHMNHGVYFTLPDKRIYLFDEYIDDYMESAKHFAEMCQKEIGNSGIKICIENTDGFRAFEKRAIEYFLTVPVFSLTWDIGHSHSAGNVDDDFLMNHEKSISHFHMHDAVGEAHHLALGTGEINTDGRYRLARKNGARCVIETKTVESLKASVRYAKKNNWMEKQYRI